MSRVTLILSFRTPLSTGLPPPLATLDSLPEVVEVHRVVPFLPPGHIGRPSHAHPGSIPSDRFFESPPVGARRTVYVHFHCSAGFSPLHSVLGTGTFRMSLCVLSTDDHVTWTPTLFHGESTSNETRPTSRVLLLTGLLRGLWDFDPADDHCDLDIFSALHHPTSLMK